MIAWLGIALAGILNGSFAVPMKTTRTWKFEQTWSVFSLLAMVVIPWTGVLLAVPEWHSLLATVPGSKLIGLIALGLLWGAASLLYGVALDLLGLALGFAIQLGLSVVVGSLVPLAVASGTSERTTAGVIFLSGIALMIAGIIICAHAGRGAKRTSQSGTRFRLGLLIAFLGGIGSPLLNFGIQYGISLLPRNTEGRGQWVAWSVFLSAAAISQVGYCLYRIVTSRRTRVFYAPGAGRDIGLVLVMSCVWALSIFLYGISAASLGRIGTSVGWPIFLALIVIASSAWSVMLGEWKDRPRSRLYEMALACAVLVAAAFLIGHASLSGL